MADMRTNYSREIVELLRNAYGSGVRIFDSIIPLSISGKYRLVRNDKSQHIGKGPFKLVRVLIAQAGPVKIGLNQKHPTARGALV